MTVLIDHVASAVPGVGEIDPAAWAALFEDMLAEVVAPPFVRREPRLRARAYLLGLVSGLGRRNGWTLAEFAGDATPDEKNCPARSTSGGEMRVLAETMTTEAG
jgi:hypothetical protein